MTMFSLPNFCRVCLKYDKNLIDLEHIENEPNETLMSKLQQCVSEVEWSVFKPLLCHPCIKRLNIAYTFKKQCVQSATVLKSYVALVKENKKKNEPQGTSDGTGSGNAYMMLPNQKYIKIVVGPNTPANSFQNVFLNVVPTPASGSSDSKSNKDTNQNVFLNINNTFQKYIPVAADDSKEKNLNVSQLLTETKTEELSVELDPTDFSYAEGDSSGDDENGANDWEEMISLSQIAPRSNGSTHNGNHAKMFGNYVPILPKTNDDNFLNSGQHFLSSAQNFSPNSDILCEGCQKHFHSVKLLKFHIKEFHLGKYPFKCEFCYSEFVLRGDYESCLKSHKTESDALTSSITLGDFKNTVAAREDATDHDPLRIETSDVVCELCNKQFNSSSGLARHKVRKHNQKSKKKYFIKGMKNARCDICNREFSTQSYMQLHRKLHLRDDIGYKYKVFSKNRYTDSNAEQQNERAEAGRKIKTNSESDEEKPTQSDNQNEKSNNAAKLTEEMEVVEESDGITKNEIEATEQ